MKRRKDTTPYTRLTEPLVRDSGVLRPATWEEALDRAAAGFRRTLDTKGPEGFGMFSCARSTNEMNYVAQKFTRAVMGTNNVDSCNRTCHAPSVAGLARVFDSGGGTSSYAEIEDSDVIVIWGGNPREAHPIFFQHVLKAVHKGAKLFVVDPRQTSTAKWAHRQLQLEVGTDIPLANAIAREIIHSGLANTTFIERATEGYEEFAASVEPWTLEVAEQVTKVPAELIKELAHTYARADRGQMSWTLGITEHHNGTDNVLSLINLSLLAGQVGRYGAGLNPLRGQNNVQGGGDMGAIPDRMPGFQDILDPAVRAKFDEAWGSHIPPYKGKNLTQMLEAMEDGLITCVYVIGENPVQSEADCEHTIKRLSNIEHLVVQDIFLTKTAQLADVVLPASAAWCESDGTFTNSERRVQRVRKAVNPPAGARDDIEVISELARRLGHDWHYSGDDGREVWDELRSLSPIHTGMSYERLEELGGIQWPCYSEDTLEPSFLHARLWAEDPAERGRPAPFTVLRHSPPVDVLDDEFPLRLTTGRRLDSYNTGVQSGGFPSPRRRGETLDLCSADAAQLGVVEDEMVQISSRRGAIVAPVRIDEGLRPGLAFMTFHFPDEVDVNVITIEATDPVAGTAEYKAAAIRVDKLSSGGPGGLAPRLGSGARPQKTQFDAVAG
ncbi:MULTISPECIES: molybdopterin oxidoreductase family protein [unclassified Amycolatopsis]|uniref:molybdopterin oxidoreductase family protein n=1 Tax=unclassified Amycolatopsis TaxID=2618356 RepID=UPI001C6A4333|nr:molybdopterin-dependent oxidoreductase [Amycolatopsis sp. DSM 110486]QYN19542.1 molybdopterin-dependent oxidoreductase [Amycolatopsis sp. DSM 110486]